MGAHEAWIALFIPFGKGWVGIFTGREYPGFNEADGEVRHDGFEP